MLHTHFEKCCSFGKLHCIHFLNPSKILSFFHLSFFNQLVRGDGGWGGGVGRCALRLMETFWLAETIVSECLNFN